MNMKKIFVTTAMVMSMGCAFAQGNVAANDTVKTDTTKACPAKEASKALAAFIANRYPQAQTAVNRNSIDISAKGVNKATALAAVARLFHIDPSQVAAIGDGRNDLCLLEHFYGFAIRGDQVLEAAARHTVDDIAEAIAILHDRSTRNADTDNRRTVWK